MSLKLITSTHYQIHMTLITLRRSKSASNGHVNLNSPAPESVKGIEQKLPL